MRIAQVLAKEAIARDKGKDDEFYFMKDLILVMDIEPCYMCSMALIHSRIAKVFFVHPNPADGGLLSTSVQIFSMKNLNHSFSAFQVIP